MVRYEFHKITVFDNKCAHILESLKAVSRRRYCVDIGIPAPQKYSSGVCGFTEICKEPENNSPVIQYCPETTTETQ